VKHPSAYKEKMLKNADPTHESENLTDVEREEERMLLNIRLPQGIQLASVSSDHRVKLEPFLSDGHLSAAHWERGVISLTQSGRLLADRIVRDALA
jgi:oxygen-independent coproporphyrinogen-3 oxidase